MIRAAALNRFSVTGRREGFDLSSQPLIYRLAIVLWITFVVAVSVKTIVSPVIHSTYPVFAAGTKCWWADRDMYDKGTCRYEYRYGPAFAVALTPVAYLPIRLGGLLWTWANLAFFYWSMTQFMRRVLPGQWTREREGWFLLLVLLGSIRGFWAAQSNALVFGLIGLAAVAIVEQKWWWASLLLALPVHVKVWPLAAAMLLIACWPRQLAVRFALALLAVGAVPFVTKPADIVQAHYVQWFEGLAGPMQERHIYRDAWTIWEQFQKPVDDINYTVLQLSMAAFALGLCLQQRDRGLTPKVLVTFVCGIWATWQLAFGPGTEQNTFGIIAPLTGWALITSFERKEHRWLMGASFVMTTILSNGNIERLVRGSYPAIMAVHPVGVLLFGAWLLCHLNQPDQAPTFAANTGSERPELLSRAA